jgi:hypothetical protein
MQIVGLSRRGDLAQDGRALFLWLSDGTKDPYNNNIRSETPGAPRPAAAAD